MSKDRYPLDDPHDIVGGLEAENAALRARLAEALDLLGRVNASLAEWADPSWKSRCARLLWIRPEDVDMAALAPDDSGGATTDESYGVGLSNASDQSGRDPQRCLDDIKDRLAAAGRVAAERNRLRSQLAALAQTKKPCPCGREGSLDHEDFCEETP